MYLVFDIGGTNARVAVSHDGKEIKEVKTIPTLPEFNEGMQSIQQAADELRKGEKITGIAGGVAGPLDKDKSMLISSPHIPGWIQKPMKAWLQQVFNVPTYLENDTAMIGLGEAVRGIGKDSAIVAYIGIGTGVGGKRIVNGKIPDDSSNFEPGHQIIVPDGNPCTCGGKGHLETYIGGYYLEKDHKTNPAEIKDPAIWDKVAQYLSIGLNNTIVHWTPDIVVLGGSIMQSLPLENIISHLGDVQTIYPQTPPIVKASLGDYAGLYGALEFFK